MNKELFRLIEAFSNDEISIPPERKGELDEVVSIINQHLVDEDSLEIIVVCTHNSRRSQLGEVWINLLAHHFGIKNIKAYSGGVEETAFNVRMVNALKNCGFGIEEKEGGENPRYIAEGIEMDNHLMFSKVYSNAMNPQQGFMAFMVCGHADENCPIVQGMKYRIPLRYKDPKEFDDTEFEEEAYINKVKEIGNEMYYLISRIK